MADTTKKEPSRLADVWWVAKWTIFVGVMGLLCGAPLGIAIAEIVMRTT